MFTGIIEEVGSVEKVLLQGASGKLEISANTVLEGTKLGDSIAVNGVCLTVTDLKKNGFTADVMAETLRRSSLGDLKKGSHVNLERAMAADGRFGGHIVSGHIDGIGTISNVKPESNAVWYEIEADEALINGIVEKGSITIDGISLTVAWVKEDAFAVSINLYPTFSASLTLASASSGLNKNVPIPTLGIFLPSFNLIFSIIYSSLNPIFYLLF